MITKALMLILFFCGLGITHSSAQQPLKFRSVNYVGLLEGDIGSSAELQTINGLCQRSWFIGLGAGLDFYRYRSIPVFLSVTKGLSSGAQGFFAGMDAGFNQPWYSPATVAYGISKDRFAAGVCYDAQVGYKIALGKTSGQSLILSIGYSYKQLKEDQTQINWYGNGPNTQQVYHYDYRNRRLSVKMGLQF